MRPVFPVPWREAGLWCAYIALSTSIGATSNLIEYHRLGLEIARWEPFVWEYSSGVVLLLLIPLVVALEKRIPLTAERWRPHLALHLAATFPFSGLHVAAMVALRKLAYAANSSTYDFSHGNLGLELLYEWRKDLLTYGLILFALNAYRVFRERAEGEASYVAASVSSSASAGSFRVSHRGRDTQLAQEDVRWVEAAGNYVILHASQGGHYMMRSTLKALEDRLAPARFLRVHRSAIINLAQVSEVASSEGLVTLQGGERIRVSRRLMGPLRAALRSI